MSVKRSNPASSRAKTIRLSNRNSKCENYALLSIVDEAKIGATITLQPRYSSKHSMDLACNP